MESTLKLLEKVRENKTTISRSNLDCAISLFDDIARHLLVELSIYGRRDEMPFWKGRTFLRIIASCSVGN